MYRPIKDNTIVGIQINWYKSFSLFPHRTITGHITWFEPIYKRIVWKYTGLTDEPFTEYATLLDILADTRSVQNINRTFPMSQYHKK